MESFSESYKNAGVDVTAGYESVRLIKNHIARTAIPGTVSGIGGFGGLFEPDLLGMKNPVLVSGTDGIGTKLKLAFLMDKHDTVGIDCVAMCVNDVICCGAKPLFFLDYIAVGKNYPQKVASIVSGIADGCVTAGCALIGGETAEMPDFYNIDEYDVAGFCVGVVDKEKLLDSKTVQAGDVIIGIKSSGVHSNGFSLVRKIFRVNSDNIHDYYDELGCTLGEELLRPTRIYVKPILSLLENIPVHAISHITGGGFYENIPRSLPQGLTAKIEKSSLPNLPIFDLIAHEGEIPMRDMFNTFNMGIGMCCIVPKEYAGTAVGTLIEAGENAFVIGEMTEGEEGIILC